MLKHNFCRTCGAEVRIKSVCLNCGCPPLKGHNYCCDCGSATLPDAIMCVNCNTALKKKFPVATVALITAFMLIAAAGLGVYFFRTNTPTGTTTSKSNIAKTDTPQAADKIVPPKIEVPAKSIQSVIDSNAIRNKILRAQADTLKKLMQAMEIKKPKQPSLPTHEKNTLQVVSKKISITNFSAKELDDYTIGCSYFSNEKNKNSVIFFYTRSLGYAKINGTITQLKMTVNDKGNGILKFTGNPYDVTIYIEGLSGSENEWFASGTLSVSDAQQGIMSQRKIYSSCAMD